MGKSNVTYKNKERKRKGEMNENDAKEDKKPDLCGLGIDFMCVAVWRGRYDSTDGRVKDIW